MPNANAEQIAEWNGEIGRRWARLQALTTAIVWPFGAAAMALAAPQPGERVIDVGCGCGDTSLDLARRVGAAGQVLGVDVSQPMLEVARAQADVPPWLEFREADASAASLPAGRDLLFSRFGVMFFDEPAPALRHLRLSLRSGGRLVFACWRHPRDNGWALAPLVAAREVLGIVQAAADPDAPGPFAFADGARLGALLAEAGYGRIDLQRFDAPVRLGATPRAAAEQATQVGPPSRLVREQGAERLPEIVDAIERALVPYASADGSVSLNGSTWLVSALAP